eukprot:CAMPEP_0197633768 /NCGR_PEP_ID=MMETSP1338-20131121/10056_1 /TAXON_ID=43686 ORGANISM="Pelagodinium beii, Strain RCC1491" /NCGR_SAMPLE_ID=MMETSP1338 /ASSEMBLY_ACC=CAM_ASM_000754 /LENGTH=238 /DNA_ID=CAMNT_0043205503 /DNA_START=56 /DNA_END=773 /DNA_ORIENTATION=+
MAAQPFQFYIKHPDGSLTLHEGQPPAGYVEISQYQRAPLPMATSMVAPGGYSYSAFPQATSMGATPMPMEYAAPAPVTTGAAPAATAPVKKKSLDLPYQKDRLEERKKLWEACDPNGNGFVVFSWIETVFREKYGLDEEWRFSFMLVFDKAKKYKGVKEGETCDSDSDGPNSLEKREFRIFLELAAKKMAGEGGAPTWGITIEVLRGVKKFPEESLRHTPETRCVKKPPRSAKTASRL